MRDDKLDKRNKGNENNTSNWRTIVKDVTDRLFEGRKKERKRRDET